MTRSNKHLPITLAAAMAAVSFGLLPLGEGGGLCASAAADSQGVAVVINADLALDVELPRIEELRADPGGVAQAFRDAGLRVTVDPTGRCLAVTPPSHITDEDLLTADLFRAAFLVGIFERTTSEQLAARKMGYLRIEALSEVQRAAALRLARRCSMVDEQGKVTEAGTHLSVEISRTWATHVVTHGSSQQPSCLKLFAEPRPPTEAAIARPPLAGSVLWWAWPYAQADWGDEEITLEAGTYALDDLLARLSRDCRLDMIARPPASQRELAVVANHMSVRKLLWAIEVALGLPARIVPDADVPMILLTPDMTPGGSYHPDYNVLLPMPGLGYWSPADSPVGRKMLSSLEGGPAQEGRDWIGWLFSDLPLLYRNLIRDEWKRTYQARYGKSLHPLEPDHTFVFWTKSIRVSINLQLDDGSGGGSEFVLPAL